MIDLDYLTKLIALTSRAKIAHIKMAGLELAFHVEQVVVQSATEAKVTPPPALEVEPPPNMQVDLMNEDQIRDWSAPTSEEPTTIPLVNDLPLGEQ